MKRGTFLKVIPGLLGLLAMPKGEPKMKIIEEVELHKHWDPLTLQAMNRTPEKVNEMIRLLNEIIKDNTGDILWRVK